MKRVLTAVVLIPLVLLIVFKAPLWLFALAVAGIIWLALHEYLGIAEAAEVKPFRCATYVAALLPIIVLLGTLVLSEWQSHPRRYHDYPAVGLQRGFTILCFLLPVIFGTLLVFRKDLKGGLASVASSAFGVLYIGVSLSVLIALRADFVERILVIVVMFSVWAGDIAAYYVGRSIGRHKLAPIVSPNKSWEGAVASVIGSVIVAAVVLHYGTQINSWFSDRFGFSMGPVTFYTPSRTVDVTIFHAILLGIFTNVAAQFGDLFESALKRGAGVKDSGTLLPGHGGILDRIDALLFAIPVVWYYANLTGFLQPKF
ncbi:MAG TPA: phosphatidate cytidylyltransferase [Candidatus Angelobacter sp.]|jgi:phosphatidate cytidylyltransferase|nr:phosphatidate cytidylyltransferase [Candidatus Angelobacter sp.]